MKTSSVRFGGLGTRVAARTFALFCLCAIVPIVVSAIVADRIVRTKLRDDAATHLESTSKSYGLLVFERLRQTDEALTELAALGLEDRLALEDIRSLRSSHFEVVDVVADDAISACAAPVARPTALSLQGTQVRLTVVQARGPRRLQITAAVDPSYFWNPTPYISIRCGSASAGQAPSYCNAWAKTPRSGRRPPVARRRVVAVPRPALRRRRLVGADGATGIGCTQCTRLLRAHAADRHAHRHRRSHSC